MQEDISYREMYDAWRDARRGKRPSCGQMAFDANWAVGLLRLQDQINAGTWKPRPSSCFVSKRPKTREIHAPNYADRIVHHLLTKRLEQVYEPRFIHDSYANRCGKGSHAAVRRVQQFVRQVASGQGGGWYLQIDIHNCFYSIPRERAWRMMKPVLIRAGVPLWVLHTTHALLRSPPLQAGVTMRGTPADHAMVPPHKRLANAPKGCGLPIGNLFSQFVANVLMDALDQYAKHVLGAQRYVRYVDDMLLIDQDRARLESHLAAIEQFLGKELGLSLKADIRLRRLEDGIDFLGYVVRPTHTLVRPRVVAHAREAMAQWEGSHVRGDIITATPADLRAIQATAASYAGHLRHANSYRLQAALRRRFPWLGAATRRRRFHRREEGRRQRIRVRSSA